MDRRRLKQEVRIDRFRASGPGGQHVNKTESAVRLVHIPTGVTVVASDTSSQVRNLALAFTRLEERLARLRAKPKPRRPTKPSRAAEERRLQAKQRRSLAKRRRAKPASE